MAMDELIDVALKAGATRGKLMDAKDVVVDRRVRMKCSVPLCDAYGLSLTCPPNTMQVEEFEDILARYKKALFVQVDTDQNSMDKSLFSLGEVSKDLFHEHMKKFRPFRLKLYEVIEKVEAAAFKQGYHYAAGFGAGRCSLCGEECPGILDGKCRHPYRARPAMEAVGIDISKTAAKAGFSVELSSESAVKCSGLILID